jgi:hemolysin activation/secretion protein
VDTTRLDYPASEQPCFKIESIILAGDGAAAFQFSLQAVTKGKASALHRCLGVQGINAVISRVQNAIIHRGFITTRVLAPRQNLSQGVLQLQLVPGRLKVVRRVGNEASRAQVWTAFPGREGDLVNLRDIEQGLENLKRLPTVDADIQIEAASGISPRPGESDLAVRWQQDFPWRFSASLDDAGSESTGKYQGSLTLSYDNPFSLNDLFYITATHDLDHGLDKKAPGQPKGTQGYIGHYSLPFGYWLLALNGSRNGYHQSVAGASQTYVYSGSSRNQGIEVSRVVYRDAQRKTTLAFKGYVKSSNNYIDDTEIEVQRRRMAGWEAEISHREYIAAATLSGAYAYRHGTGAMNALEAPEEAFGEGTARPVLRTASLQLAWPFRLHAVGLRFNSDWRAQWNDTPLVPLDRFSIGGRYTVRGFDGEQVLSAERGFVWRNELSLPWSWPWLAGGHELYLACDEGRVDGPSSDALIGKSLAGSALGLRGAAGPFSYDVFVSRPLRAPDGFRSRATPAGFNLNFSY